MTEKEIISGAILVGGILRVENWMELKKILLVTLSSQDRSNFSTRDPKTKKQSLNKFEERLIDNYYSETGISLIKGV
jgi:hypothetical protein